MTGIEYHSIYEQGWYDIDIQRSAKRIEEVPGLKESAEYVTMLIEKELADDKTKKVVLGGFSQGILLDLTLHRRSAVPLPWLHAYKASGWRPSP